MKNKLLLTFLLFVIIYNIIINSYINKMQAVAVFQG